MLAYLVIREGAQWTDVFRLVPGETVTVGRAPNNKIVLKDERCSRNHAEVYLANGDWMLRDLGSRNGTIVADRKVENDYLLSPGDVIRIGRCQLAFVHDLSKAFTDSGILQRPDSAGEDDITLGDSSVLSAHEPATITHRKGQTRFLEPEQDADDPGISPAGKAASMLCRLGFEFGNAPDAMTLAKLALEGLFAGTHVDTGAVLLLPRGLKGEPAGADLRLVASRADSQQPYHRVGSFLASTVLREGEAVLARNVQGDSALGSRDSKGVIHATSVICAPIRPRRADPPLGLIHLYSTDAERVLEPDDLEFTLAVAESVAVALVNLTRQQELTSNLIQVRSENEQLRQRLGVQSDIIGTSEVIKRVTDEIARAAPSKATVLIRGESGVGKELVARAVHDSSPRGKGVFVCLNCAALTETLLESELFGHERGAFTGATERKIGKFEAAHEGTLMLDEIGEMSPTIQAKFLRVLEGHPFERVGGSEPVKVDVRVIAATNRDLERDVAEGKFRRDLYFRLKVLEIVVPALRKRPEDIPALAQYFIEKFNAETGRKIKGMTPEARGQLLRYRWPGNVRELKNVVERAVVLCQGEWIDEDDLVLSTLPTAGDTVDVPRVGEPQFEPTSLAEMEQRHILSTLESTGWNKSQTATILGIERSTLDRKIKRYGLADAAARRGR